MKNSLIATLPNINSYNGEIILLSWRSVGEEITYITANFGSRRVFGKQIINELIQWKS